MFLRGRSRRSLDAVSLFAALLLTGGVDAVAAPEAQASTATAYSAIDETGVLSDTATGSATTASLNGSSLADGVTLKGAGITDVQTYTDPDDSTADVVSVGPDSGTPPTTYGDSVIVTVPSSTTSLDVHKNSGAPVHDIADDATTEADFSTSGIATAPTSLTDTDVGVQSVSDGARLLSVANSAAASHKMTYTFSLPAGAQLVPATASLDDENNNDPDLTPTTYVIVQNDQIIGDIEAPWAKDANGASVPTSYTVSGNQLIQTVDFTSANAFPVVADPKVSFGWWIYTRWSRAEVRRVALKIGGGAAVITAVCDLIPNHHVSTLCKAVTLYGLAHIGAVFVKAATKKCKVELKFAYSPVYKIKTYSCQED